MSGTTLFFVQTIVSFIVFALLTWWHLMPRIKSWPLEKAVAPFIWIHAFRNVGLSTMAPGAVDPSLPAYFTQAVGFGDLTASILAIVSLIALRYRVPGAIVLVWLFNIVGIADLINASRLGLQVDGFEHPLGASWLIVTMYVPALWVSGLAIFYLLLTRKQIDS